jgi:hypothetical protein
MDAASKGSHYCFRKSANILRRPHGNDQASSLAASQLNRGRSNAAAQVLKQSVKLAAPLRTSCLGTVTTIGDKRVESAPVTAGRGQWRLCGETLPVTCVASRASHCFRPVSFLTKQVNWRRKPVRSTALEPLHTHCTATALQECLNDAPGGPLLIKELKELVDDSPTTTSYSNARNTDEQQ